MLQAVGETVAVVAFDGISPFHLAVPSLVFGEGMAGGDGPHFEVRVGATGRKTLRTTAGFTIRVTQGLEAVRAAGIVVVPSWHDDGRPAPAALLDALRAAHARGAILLGLCLGAFVLAEAGLLDGRPAVTHWNAASRFAERFPAVRLRRDVLYVDDGDVLTSAGTAAGIDCCLHLLRVRYGAEVANRAARRMVVAPHRQGGQAQYIEQPVSPAAERDRLGPLLDWLGAHLDQPHSLDSLARRALMSRRTFTRRFHKATGTTVGRWLEGQRLAMAQRLLERDDQPIESVAAQTGFVTAVSLRQRFRSAFGVSPSDYRRQFSMR